MFKTLGNFLSRAIVSFFYNNVSQTWQIVALNVAFVV